MEEKEKTEQVKKDGGTVRVSKKSLGVIAALVVVVVLGFVIYQNMNSGVAAVVNGEEITVEELNQAYDTLPAQYKASTTKSDLLEQLVQAKVFYQEAVEEGIVVEEAEANQQIELLKMTSSMTEEQFNQALAAQGLTEEGLVDQYEKQMTIQKYLDQEFISTIEVSEEEARDYYDENPEQFEQEESVVVRHILIGDEDLTPEEQKKEASLLIARTTKENFCEAVKEHTTDVASADTCGEYAFTRNDPLVEKFKELSFKQGKGQIGMVDTEFGTHIIWTVDKLPARTVPFDEAKLQIEEFLRQQKAQEQYDEFYNSVAADSDIKIRFEEI